MERITAYTPDQSDLLWQWTTIQKLLNNGEDYNEVDAEALYVWHLWCFNECYDAGLIVEICEARDKYNK